MSGGRERRTTSAQAVAREHTIIAVRQTLERFTIDLARLLAGHDVSFAECASAETAQRVHAAVEPFLRSGARLAPDFGQFAEVAIAGDVLGGVTLDCCVSFDDRSPTVRVSGERTPPQRRRIDLRLQVQGAPPRVTDFAVAVHG